MTATLSPLTASALTASALTAPRGEVAHDVLSRLDLRELERRLEAHLLIARLAAR